MVDFNFFKNDDEYKHINRVRVATEGYNAGMLVNDTREESAKTDNSVLTVMVNTNLR